MKREVVNFFYAKISCLIVAALSVFIVITMSNLPIKLPMDSVLSQNQRHFQYMMQKMESINRGDLVLLIEQGETKIFRIMFVDKEREIIFISEKGGLDKNSSFEEIANAFDDIISRRDKRFSEYLDRFLEFN